MVDATELEKKELENLSEDEKVMELDQLITEGVNAKIPFQFIYPNTTKKVGVMIRPLSTGEYQSAIVQSRKFKTNFLNEILKIGLYKMDGDEFPPEQIEQLPAGVVTRISNEIARISGVDLAENVNENQAQLFDEIMGF